MIQNSTDAYLGVNNSHGVPNMREIMFIQNQAVHNLLSRSDLSNRVFDPRRDIDNECGYAKTNELDPGEYRRMFDRESISRRVVELLPTECWAVQPEVFESADIENITPFEKAWKELPSQLSGPSWHKDDENNTIWSFLKRADILSGIGSFGIVLLGFDDGEDLSQPVVPREGMHLTFIRTFDESLVDIVQYENNPNNPRFDQPVMYSVSFNDTENSNSNMSGQSITDKMVHYSRVIHVADNRLSSEVFGVPRQQPVWNRLMDLRKLLAGCAEMYWKGAFPGISWETHPQLGGDVNISDDGLKAAIEDYQNKLQRHIITAGMTANSMSTQVVDPTPQVNIEIQAIAILLGVPVRIFIGSERGELSSSQDENTWNGRLQERQTNYLTPDLVVPFIDRLIHLKVLPVPLDGYKVEWPDLFSLSESEKAAIAKTQTETMALYIQGDVEALIPPLPYFTSIMNIPLEEAQSLIETVEEIEDESGQTGDESKLLGLVGGLKGTADIMAMLGRGEVTREQAQGILELFFKMTPEEIDGIIGTEVIVPPVEEPSSSGFGNDSPFA